MKLKLALFYCIVHLVIFQVFLSKPLLVVRTTPSGDKRNLFPLKAIHNLPSQKYICKQQKNHNLFYLRFFVSVLYLFFFSLILLLFYVLFFLSYFFFLLFACFFIFLLYCFFSDKLYFILFLFIFVCLVSFYFFSWFYLFFQLILWINCNLNWKLKNGK